MAEPADLDFLVRTDDLSTCRFEAASNRELAPGEVIVRVDRYALTANNITYAYAGALMRYWDFFPATQGWGRIPVWGYADVVASRVSELPEGERVYGYLPMSTRLRMKPARVTAHGFTDASEHRRGLPGIYQRYRRSPREDGTREDVSALLRPLFTTGFLIDAWLADERDYGARQILIASASSKTALGAAFALSQRGSRDFEVVGLTSSGNRGFCERVGYYDRVVDYAEIGALPASTASVLIDMSGNAAILRALHEHFGPAMRHTCQVGFTHGMRPGAEAGAPLAGPVPEFFFAPTHVEQRIAAWGSQAFESRLREAQAAFSSSASSWLEVVRGAGPAAIEDGYRRTLAGRVAPSQGLILSP